MVKLLIFFVMLFNSGLALALSKSEIRSIIEEAYPGAKVTEIEKERYKGENIYEVDFRHGDKKLEAILSLEGKIIKVDTDD